MFRIITKLKAVLIVIFLVIALWQAIPRIMSSRRDVAKIESLRDELKDSNKEVSARFNNYISGLSDVEDRLENRTSKEMARITREYLNQPVIKKFLEARQSVESDAFFNYQSAAKDLANLRQQIQTARNYLDLAPQFGHIYQKDYVNQYFAPRFKSANIDQKNINEFFKAFLQENKQIHQANSAGIAQVNTYLKLLLLLEERYSFWSYNSESDQLEFVQDADVERFNELFELLE